MSTEIAILKRDLRQRLRARLQAISPERRNETSLQACALLREQPFWAQARSVLFYSPLQTEIDLLPLLAQALFEKKSVALPRYLSETATYTACEIENLEQNCAPGKFGILEPSAECPVLALNRLDLVLVPGVGFDPMGHRLGRGQGFYDRLLAQVSGIKCGVAFDEQMVQEVPAEPHDVRLNCILTPTHWHQVAR
jgi:5-formyltetrahydrofolate cyclo-ligase